jgi:hypothetical protein
MIAENQGAHWDLSRVFLRVNEKRKAQILRCALRLGFYGFG